MEVGGRGYGGMVVEDVVGCKVGCRMYEDVGYTTLF